MVGAKIRINQPETHLSLSYFTIWSCVCNSPFRG